MRVGICLLILTFGIQLSLGQTLHTRNKDLPNLNKHFHLHVHVAVDSLRNTKFTQQQIQGSINGCNKFFAPIGVSFSLCQWDTIHNYNFDSIATSLEVDEIRTHYHKERRINIYLASELLKPDQCGFASTGGIGSLNNAYIFLKKACPGSLTHEMGHLFGLAHTFEGNGTELVDGSNCQTAGDGLCDTPADPFNPADDTTIWTDGCEFIWQGTDANGDYYQPDVGNIMSYYSCPCGFTREQYLLMVENYRNATKKHW